MKKLIISIGLLGILFTGNVFAQTETSGRTEYRQTHTKSTELKHTKLKVNFENQKEQMNGEEWLTASPHFYPSDSLVLAAKARLIHEVTLDLHGSKRPPTHTYKD